MFDDWKGEPATCAVEGNGPKRTFMIDGRSMPFWGPTSLGTDQMTANVAQKHPDFDAAKAALAASGAPP